MEHNHHNYGKSPFFHGKIHYFNGAPVPGYLLCMKFFCLSAVFEYGLVSYLLQVETAQERKFLAFKHLAATVRAWALKWAIFSEGDVFSS